MSREYSKEEVREMFLSHVQNLIRYWDKANLDRQYYKGDEQYERLAGLAFSILVAIDGGAGGLPGFILAPRPHENDKEYHKSEGENWFPENHKLDDKIKADIAGCLHELLKM